MVLFSVHSLLLGCFCNPTESLSRTLTPGPPSPGGDAASPVVAAFISQARQLSWGPCSSLGRGKEAAKGLCNGPCSSGLALTRLDLPLFHPSQLLPSLKVLGQRKQPVKTAQTEPRLAQPTVFALPVRGSCSLEPQEPEPGDTWVVLS